VLRSAKAGLISRMSLSFLPLRPHPLKFTAIMNSGASWQLPRIWLWNKTDPEDIGPLAALMSVGLYGKITTYPSQLQLTTTARRLHGSFLTVHVDYVSGRGTIFRGSLGGGSNVWIRPFPILFNKSHLSALWLSPSTSPLSSWIVHMTWELRRYLSIAITCN
jgi:hypothetical protein